MRDRYLRVMAWLFRKLGGNLICMWREPDGTVTYVVAE